LLPLPSKAALNLPLLVGKKQKKLVFPIFCLLLYKISTLFRMQKILIVLALATVSLSACNSSSKSTANKTNPTHFGGEMSKGGAIIPVSDLFKKMGDKKEISTKIEGTAVAVCQAKGCWMTLQSNPTSEPIMVKFKDYAFFMPKDLAGKKVICEGIATKTITPVDELRHYAEDEGKSAAEIAKITQPKEEIVFMASSVDIKN
jgi:hypothetical protein